MPEPSEIREVAFGSPLYGLTVQFRDAHLRRPLGLTLGADDLAGEERQIHIAAIRDGGVDGTVLLKPLASATVKLRQMAVAPAMRGHGLGSRLVRFAEGLALARGFESVTMAARVDARGFYERLGYEAFGAPFIEVTVPHVGMAKRLAT